MKVSYLGNLLRRVVKPLAGRKSPVWRLIRSPELRLLLFRDPVDYALYSLSISRKEVFFIQIGAHDGGPSDPLFPFFQLKHWRGIMVEPVPYLFEQLQARYGTDDRFTLVNAAVATASGTVPFHFLPAATDLPRGFDQLGSLSRERLLSYEHLMPNIASRIATAHVKAITLAELCEQLNVQTIDLIQIDVEGFDYEVLRQIDIRRYQPAIIIYEHKLLTPDDQQRALDLMHTNGYTTTQLGQDTLARRIHVKSRRQEARLLSGLLST